jgi:tight adherence protein B
VKRRALALAGLLLALTSSASIAADQPLKIVATDTSRLPLVSTTVKAPEALVKKGTPKFTITENGKPVSGVKVSDPNTGAGAVLEVDASRSMIGEPLAKAVAGARAFGAAKRSNDQLSVISFGNEVSAAIPLTSDPTSIDAALREITVSPKQGTALYDALLDGVKTVADAGVGRRVLVVLTDGDDTSSTATTAQVIAAAHQADVAIYAIALKSTTFKPDALRGITSATGGDLFQANANEIKQVYAKIAADLHRTYVLEYTSSLPAKRLTVSVHAPGARPATTSFAAAVPIFVKPAKTNATVASLSSNPLAGLLLALGAGGAVLLGALLLFRPSSEKKLAKRIDGYAQVVEKRVETAAGPRSPLFQSLLTATEHALGRLKYWVKVGKLLQQADLALRPSEVFYIQLGVGAAFGILSTLFGMSPIVSVAAFALGLYIPYFWIKRKAKKRLSAFEAQLPDTLIAVAASLRAGHSFAQAMSTIVKDGGEPAAKEFGRVETETRLGRSTDDALQAMADRLQSKNFEFVVLAVNIQRTVGGSLSDILDMVADTVRAREQFGRKVKALTAMGRGSAYVLVGMPFVIGLILLGMSRPYMRPLLFTSTGHYMIIASLVSITLGSIILRKIVNFRY